MPPDAPTQWHRRPAVQAAAILAASFAYLAWLQFLTPYIAETDGYFHVKVAALLRARGVLDAFPWTAFSLWSEHYFDKEWLYHLLLGAFAGGDLVRGAKWAAVTFGTAVFVSFFLVLRASGIRTAWFWTLLLLLGSGGYFGWRVCLTRPHVFSITLSLWAMSFVLRAAPRRLFATSVVYALSYTAPHVAVGYAALNVAVRRVLDRRFRPGLLVAAAAGVAAGWLLHPHRRSALLAVWTQTVQVLLSNQRYGTPDLRLGGELSPAPWEPFLREHAAVFLAMAVAAWMAWRLRARLGSASVTLALTSLGWLAMTLLSKRFVEYWVPFTFWACASVIDPLLPRWGEAVPWREKAWAREAAVAAIVAALAFACGHTIREDRRNFRGPRAPGGEAAAAWLRAHTPEGSLVFTCDWDDTPELLFFDDRNRYLVALDPNFMYRWRPRLWEAWSRVANGKSSGLPADEILGTFGARYGYCTRDFRGLELRLRMDPRVTVHALGGGYVFEIAPPRQDGARPAAALLPGVP